MKVSIVTMVLVCLSVFIPDTQAHEVDYKGSGESFVSKAQRTCSAVAKRMNGCLKGVLNEHYITQQCLYCSISIGPGNVEYCEKLIVQKSYEKLNKEYFNRDFYKGFRECVERKVYYQVYFRPAVHYVEPEQHLQLPQVRAIW